MRAVFRSFDLSIDEEMRRSNRLFFKVEKICQISGDNSPRIGRFFSIKMEFRANGWRGFRYMVETILHKIGDSSPW